ncbi:type VII secretion protein EsaA [Streptococcus oralis]|uniref:type VII secretion protein EsaA n=2 Tax=Streptococcus oralis TaxID=1303 RepID=UPI001CBB7DC5|nr:type VII secretion protein EsaA [Streptococcus oralis]MBZ2102791.1 type VII secretion protein EsaA [Streptococcus oralis]
MGKNRVYKYIGNSLLVLFLLASMIVLNISVQKNTTINNEKNVKASQQTKLNVAIVNEDQPVHMDTKEYNLGASYVKNIERDNSQNWFVVTRGAADAGLESGKYQLVLTIPSDFSEKILDINNINVDKTTITYKVNAQGNLQVENDANKLAKDIVADLNSQLVDMYMASILSNLYTAQKNVQASSQIQTTNIGTYRTNLLGTATNSKNLFPTLFSMSSSSVDANQALKKVLESYSQVFEHLDASQINYGKNFEALLEQRKQENSTADILSQMISQSKDEVHSQVTAYEQALKEYKILTSQLGTLQGAPAPTYTGTQGPSYQELTGSISQEIAGLENNLKLERNKFDEHKKNIKTFVEEKLADYYGVSKKSTITLEQFLNKAGNKDLDTVIKSIETQLKLAIEELPKEDFSGHKFTSFGISPITIPKVDYHEVKNIATPTDGTTLTDLNNLESHAVTSTSAVGKTGTKAKVSWTSDTGLTIDSVFYDGKPVTFGQEIDLKTGGAFRVEYSVSSVTSNPTIKPAITISLNDIQAVSAPVDVLKVQQAAVSYGQKVQKIASSYDQVNSLLSAYKAVNNLRNSDLSGALSNIWFEAITSNLQKYEDSLADSTSTSVNQKVDQALANLVDLKPKLEKNLSDVLKNNDELSKKINAQYDSYTQLRGKLDDLVTKQATNERDSKNTDSALSALSAEYTALLGETSGVKASSQSNIKAAESVNEVLSNFNRELSNAQSSTEKLSQDAESLMTQFNEELAANGNFVDSFVKVLNNAYENGVPNEVLLNFLSSPVAQSSSSVKATVNVYRPFTWILLLEIVSLFTAYLFATQNIIRKVKDKFKLDKLHDTDILTVGILSFLAVAIGLVIGIVSNIQLQVGREYQPSWVLLIVLAGFILVQGQYLFLKHLRVIGMGLAFFMMISFVYLSNAIGTTASLTGFPAFIKNLNALSVLEGLLSGYFDGHPAALLAFIAMIVAIAVLLVVNTFIKGRNFQYQATQTEKE